MLTKKEYFSSLHLRDIQTMISALQKHLEVKIIRSHLDRKIVAIANTKNKTKPHKPPKGKWIFTRRFFTMLSMMPSIKIDVKESRSHIRKTSYGFRDRITSDRVYLRVENGSVVMFRDNPAGYIIGVRFFFPRIDSSYQTNWRLVQLKMYNYFWKRGVRIRGVDLVVCLRTIHRWRVVLSNVLISKGWIRYTKHKRIVTRRVRKAQREDTKQ